jgi:hypothetical protein
MSIASRSPVTIASSDVAGDAIANQYVQVHAELSALPHNIGEALPAHQCEANPRLELCQPDAGVGIPADLSPFVDAAAAMLMVYLVFFIAKLFTQSDDDQTRTNIQVALAVGAVGLLFTYFMS